MRRKRECFEIKHERARARARPTPAATALHAPMLCLSGKLKYIAGIRVTETTALYVELYARVYPRAPREITVLYIHFIYI